MESFASTPTGSEAVEISGYIDAISLKGIAAHLAEQAIAKIEEQPIPDQPEIRPLTSKVATQKDLESDWSRYWVKKLGLKVSYNRKMWEYAFLLQSLYSAGMLKPGRRGLGLGCGNEPIPSYLTAQGCDIVAGDKPEGADESIWRQVGTYTATLDSLHWGNIISKEEFAKRCRIEYLDMNKLPEKLFGQFDFCWSVCAVEHIGGIEAGLAFLRDSLNLLKPGGVSIHTTEFNYMNIPKDFDTKGLCFFKREHFIRLAEAVKILGCEVASLDFDWGNMVFDRYLDQPPYNKNRWDILHKCGLTAPPISTPHIKLNYQGVPITCFGLVITKPL